MSTGRHILTGAPLFTGERILHGRAVVIEAGRIAAVLTASALPPDVPVTHLPDDMLLAPGFIDAQVNGAGGLMFNDAPDVESACAIAASLRPSGTTGLLPTLITDSRDKMEAACEAALAASALPASGVLGLHLEGPFISPDRPGVHDPRFIRAPDEHDLALLAALPARLGDAARLLVTFAPEQVGDDAIARLADAGVALSVGHSAASHARTMEAVAAGARGFTHLFNAMPPVANREPGPVGAAFDASDTWCGIIADGVHVHPSLLKAAIRARPRRIFLVSDAMAPVGTEMTSFDLYGRTIYRRDGRLTTENGTLAGADIDMIGCVRNTVDLLGQSLEEALRMASLYPAMFLGLDHRFGRVSPGYRADLVLLDLAPRLDVAATWVNGEVAWHGETAVA